MVSLHAELDKCARCGACRAVCPVFKVLQDETTVSRGRITLLEALAVSGKPGVAIHGQALADPKTAPADIKINKRIRTILDCCLMCLRCRAKCPAGVKTDMIFQTGRALFNLGRVRALPLLIVFRFIIPVRFLYNKLLRLLYRFQETFGPAPDQELTTLRHLPFSLSTLNRLPELAPHPALELTKKRILPSKSDKHLKVALFVGCLNNYVYPQIIKKISRLFKQTDIELIIPPDQLCCGLPLLIAGDRIGARRLAQKNLQALMPDKVDWIITACTTCGRMLKEEYPLLVSAEPLTKKVIDITEFIMRNYPELITNNLCRQRTGLSNSTGSPQATLITNIKTTYHAPCHAAASEINEVTQRFLKRVSKYVETDPDNQCCGGGGSFSFKYASVARQIGTAKIETLQKYQPELVVTGCPGCIMQLNHLLRSSGITTIKACHPIEILANSISGKS